MGSSSARKQVGSIEAEFEGGDLGDERRARRLVRLATLVCSKPDASFPVAAGNDADLEATYRFLGNDQVKPEAILAPHVRQTVARAAKVPQVVIAHDTTEFNFGSVQRGDLGRVGRGKSYGFYAHVSLVVDLESREPLGVIDLRTHDRRGNKGRRGHTALQNAKDNESRRWRESAFESEVVLGPEIQPIHTMDREGDSYALIADLAEPGLRFVIRMASDKRRLDQGISVRESLVGLSIQAEREVPITARRRSPLPSYRKKFPERDARTAKLVVTATQVTLLRPHSASKSVKTLTLNVVHVYEPSPPEGEVAIEWRLWTSEPVDTAERVLAVIDAYRCRWVVEEYFKALKTGCAFEQRQLESKAALLNALAVLVPIAWRLLLLRTLARPSAATQPATRLLSARQIKCLALALRQLRRPPLPPSPTIRDAMLGVAGLGGHIKNNGDPGWIVLGRGFEKLLQVELGYLLGTEEM